MAQPTPIILLPVTPVDAPGSGAEVDVGTQHRSLVLDLRVTDFTAAGSSPLLALALETRALPGDPWRASKPIEATGLGAVQFAAGGLDRYLRVSWTLVELAEATLEVTGVSHVTYCDPDDITTIAAPEHSIAELTATQRARACIAATDVADGYVGAAYTLPLVAWSEDLRQMTAYLAAAQLFAGRGFDTEGPDGTVANNRDMALKWLDRLANGRLSPPGLIDSTPEEYDGGSFVVSSRLPRGW